MSVFDCVCSASLTVFADHGLLSYGRYRATDITSWRAATSTLWSRRADVWTNEESARGGCQDVVHDGREGGTHFMHGRDRITIPPPPRNLH